MRAAFLYPLLVGLPTAGVFAVLSVGERITPPPSLGGEWAVEVGETDAAPPVVLVPCGVAPERRALHAVGLSQSGTAATVALRDRGGVRWAEGTVALRPDASAADGVVTPAGCGAATIRVTLTPDGSLRPRAMAITLAPADCADCPPVHLRATRVARGPGTTSTGR